jgi:hypothetical protein
VQMPSLLLSPLTAFFSAAGKNALNPRPNFSSSSWSRVARARSDSGTESSGLSVNRR